MNIFASMPTTTIHVPAPLLEALDARARADGVSRNRLITMALERFVRDRESWSPTLLAELRRPLSAKDKALVDDMLREILARRSSKRRPPPL